MQRTRVARVSPRHDPFKQRFRGVFFSSPADELLYTFLGTCYGHERNGISSNKKIVILITRRAADGRNVHADETHFNSRSRRSEIRFLNFTHRQ